MVVLHLRLEDLMFSRSQRRDELVIMQVVEDLKLFLLISLTLRVEELAPLRYDAFLDLMLKEQRVVRCPYAFLLYQLPKLAKRQLLALLCGTRQHKFQVVDLGITGVYLYLDVLVPIVIRAID